jgi:carboxyl-terminal processing protease
MRFAARLALLAAVLAGAACRSATPAARDTRLPAATPQTIAITEPATGATPLDIVRQAYTEITQQLFREVAPRELLEPAWRAIAAEARRQGAQDVDVSTYQSGGSSDIEDFAREFTSFAHGPGQDLDATLLSRAAVRGMAAAIGDSHTRFLTPEQESDSRRSSEGDSSYVGIGISFESARMTITEVYMNSPAERAGLRTGDQIVRVDGREVATGSSNDLSAKVRGPEGTQVQLTVQRAGEGLLDVIVDRARVVIPIITSRMLDQEAGVGYIRVASLPRKTTWTDAARDFDDQLSRLVNQGARGVILDLRRNPGGDPFTSVAIASNFVPNGTIFSSVNRDGRRTNYPATSRSTLFQGPVAVLVDRGTASGAEVIASALQEYGAGHLIGTRTCGCLSVGRPLQLGDSSGLIVTVEQAFTGRMQRSIEGTGLQPDQQTGNRDPLREAQSYVTSRLR